MSYDDDDTNPFANQSGYRPPPAIPAASRPSGNEYNPFTNSGLPPASTEAVKPTFASTFAPTQPFSQPYQPPPSYSPSTPSYSPSTPSSQVPNIDYRGYAPPTSAPPVEVDNKQKELDEREARLAQRERILNAAKSTTERKNNFPPLPARCPIQPCFYHNISVDIASPFQRWVRFSFITWIIYSVTLLFNIITAAAYLSVNSGAAVTLGVSFLFLFLLMPCSYICWHRPVYRAFRTDSSLFFMIFFFTSVLFIATNILFAVGFLEGTTILGKFLNTRLIFVEIKS